MNDTIIVDVDKVTVHLVVDKFATEIMDETSNGEIGSGNVYKDSHTSKEIDATTDGEEKT